MFLHYRSCFLLHLFIHPMFGDTCFRNESTGISGFVHKNSEVHPSDIKFQAYCKVRLQDMDFQITNSKVSHHTKTFSIKE
jgi:hypothetical protein